jgi:tryptophan synthase alpha subunit
MKGVVKMKISDIKLDRSTAVKWLAVGVAVVVAGVNTLNEQKEKAELDEVKEFVKAMKNKTES